MAKGQSERLFPLLEGLLAEAGCTWGDVGLIGVGTGPGNFTGQRIGVSAARGLALGLGVRAVGVDVFQALAYGAARPLAAVSDARAGKLYVQFFGPEGPGEEAALIAQEELAPWLCERGSPALVAPEGGGPWEELCPDARLLPPAAPLAEAIARLACALGDAAPSRPCSFYLRPPDAAPPSAPPLVILDG